MPKITMLSGLPASGKSTYAHALVKNRGSLGRVNRDDLRAMLFDSAWSPTREKIVVDVEKAIAEILISHNHSAVVDDTNLTTKHLSMWKAVADKNHAKFESLKFDASIQECIERDKHRAKPVGAAIIQRMALLNGRIDFGTLPIVLVDIDGTLADGRHREHLVKGDRKNWNEYFSLLGQDAVYQHIVDRVNSLSVNHQIVVVSGRPDTYQFETINWLTAVAGVHYDWLFMRSGSDRRPDYIVKEEILRRLPKEQIVLCLDDRASVIEMWRRNGINTEAVRGEGLDF